MNVRILLTVICAQVAVVGYAQQQAGEVQSPNKTNVSKQSLEFITPFGRGIRRGHTTIIEWHGGTIGAEKELSLYKGDMRIASFGKMKDVWLYKWKVSHDLVKGDDYSFRLSGEGETVTSDKFRIKPQIPLLVKLSPLLLVAAVIPFLNNSKSGGAESLDSLPGAPDPE